MNIKTVLLIASVIMVLVGATIFFVVCSRQRQNDDILMEIIIWPGGGDWRGEPFYHFIVKNDGAFISYHGLSFSGSIPSNTRNFIRFIREREEINLNEETFLHVSELVSKIISDDIEGIVRGNTFVTFLHNGNIYESGAVLTLALHELLGICIELTPLTVHNLD